MDKNRIIKKLQKYKCTSDHNHNIKEIGVFGSYAKGDNTDQSDIDVFVVFKKPRMFDLVNIQKDLQIVFGKNVDVIAVTKSMNEYLRKQIHRYGIVA
jgi:predicted nucleotidyltransferase